MHAPCFAGCFSCQENGFTIETFDPAGNDSPPSRNTKEIRFGNYVFALDSNGDVFGLSTDTCRSWMAAMSPHDSRLLRDAWLEVPGRLRPAGMAVAYFNAFKFAAAIDAMGGTTRPFMFGDHVRVRKSDQVGIYRGVHGTVWSVNRDRQGTLAVVFHVPVLHQGRSFFRSPKEFWGRVHVRE